MTKKLLGLCKIIFIIALFAPFLTSSTEYIANGDFSENSCQLIKGDYSGCQGIGLLTGWTAKKISDLTSAPISIQNRTIFNSFPTTVQNVVPLDFFENTNGKYKRTCI